jgi:hypothetical protein
MARDAADLHSPTRVDACAATLRGASCPQPAGNLPDVTNPSSFAMRFLQVCRPLVNPGARVLGLGRSVAPESHEVPTGRIDTGFTVPVVDATSVTLL